MTADFTMTSTSSRKNYKTADVSSSVNIERVMMFMKTQKLKKKMKEYLSWVIAS